MSDTDVMSDSRSFVFRFLNRIFLTNPHLIFLSFRLLRVPACAVLPAVDRSSEPDSAFHNWFYYYFFQSNLAHWFTSKWTATSYLLTFPHLLFFFLAFVGLGVRGSSVLPAVDRSKSSFRDRFSFFFSIEIAIAPLFRIQFFFFFFFFFLANRFTSK